MPKWTDDQRAAILAAEKTILVSAAAGSGKTAVLVERILHLVRDQHASLSRMLIVTFTRAAAAEMRARISDRLTQEAAICADDQRAPLIRALEELPMARISTIHAFCQEVIRSSFQLVGVDPMFRVLEDQERRQLFAAAYRDALNECLEGGGPVRLTAESFGQRDLAEMVERVYTFIMATDEPEAWLRRQTAAIRAESLAGHPWMRKVQEAAMLSLQQLDTLLDEMDALVAEPDALPAMAEFCVGQQSLFRPIAEAARRQDAAAVLELTEVLSYGRAPVAKPETTAQADWKERVNDLRDRIKKAINEGRDMLQVNEAQQLHDLDTVARLTEGLCELVLATRAHYTLVKREARAIDFNDMEQLTLAVLRQPESREPLCRQFDHIFVDECQDVSRAQNAIFEALHDEGNSLFMVGDVKQSIYRFRLADPTLFLHRVRTFRTGEGAEPRKIVLQHNFRSARHILNAANNVFRDTMRARVTELDYTEEDELQSLRPVTGEAPVELHLITPSEVGGVKAELRAEGLAVARRIKALLAEPRPEDGRPYEYRDICILLSSVATHGEELARALEEEGIPVYLDGKETYYDLPEISQFRALLQCVENPLQDLPLISALRLHPFSFTSQELAAVRLRRQGKNIPFYEAFQAAAGAEDELGQRCAAFAAQLAEWRFLAEQLRLSDLIWHLLHATGFYAIAGAMPHGETRQANLRLLAQKATAFEAGGGAGLAGFLSWMDNEISYGDATSAKVLGEQENLVRIMTMHKSKGLEFPAVFLMQLGQPLLKPARGTVALQERLGICLPYINRALSIKRDTIGQTAFDFQRRQDELAERCRLLYVAMTRPRERLFLYGSWDPAKPPALWRMAPSDVRVFSAGSMLDWVAPVALADCGLSAVPDSAFAGELWRIEPETVDISPRDTAAAASEAVADWIAAASAQRGQTAPPWDTETPREAVPLKTSVTSLTRHRLFPQDVSQEEEEPDVKRRSEVITAPLRLSELQSQPDFLTERRPTAAERGTAAHHALALLSLSQLRNLPPASYAEAVSARLRELRDMGVLSQDELAVIEPADLVSYLRSPLGQRMLASPNVRREWRFNLRLPTDTLLQGVIDCCWLEDGQWVLCDYKTDYIQDEDAFVQRHQDQLCLYADALEQITGRPVRACWLYSIRLRRAFEVRRG